MTGQPSSHSGADSSTIPETLARLSDLHVEIAGVYADLADYWGIQLQRLADMSPDPCMNNGHDGAPGPTSHLLSSADVARVLGVDARTVRRWRLNGKLPAGTRIGNRIRWRPDEIQRWLEEERA